MARLAHNLARLGADTGPFKIPERRRLRIHNNNNDNNDTEDKRSNEVHARTVCCKVSCIRASVTQNRGGWTASCYAPASRSKGILPIKEEEWLKYKSQ